MRGSLEDIRLALRLLRRAPALTAVAIFSIALSVGATAVVFTGIKAVLITPLPYRKPGDLVQIRTDFAWVDKQSRADWVSWNDAQDVIRSSRTLQSLGIYHYALFNLAGDESAPPEALYGLRVSANLMPTLGVTPLLGRGILPEEEQPSREREMILSYDLWTRRFNADPGAIGRTIRINGHDCRIIGVMPADFDFPMRLATSVRTPSRHMDFWAPLGVDPASTDRGELGFGAVARLRKGVSLARARQDLALLSATLERAYPRTNRGRQLRAISLRDRTLGFAKNGLLLLMAAALVFMLIGCANVANLLLAQTLARHREIATRLALGAAPARLVRQLVTESCVLAGLGGICGYGLTVVAWACLPAVAPVSIPRLAAARADWSAFAFTMAVSLANGILFGSLPALRSVRRSPAIALREIRGGAAGPKSRLRSGLVIAEVALAAILLVIGGLLADSFVRLLRTDPGFPAKRLLASIIVPAADRYRDPEKRRMFFQQILDSVRQLPGVESAGTVDALPFGGENNGGLIAYTEAGALNPAAQQVAEVDTVSAGYLPTMGLGLLAGDWFREEDMQQSRQVAIINDIAARRWWPDSNAVGKQICVDCTADRPRQWNRVIGVVSSVRHAALDEAAGPEVYLSSGALENAQFLVVRTSRPTRDLARAIRKAIAAIDSNQPVFLSATMQSLIGDTVADRRFILTLLASMGGLALLLSTAGVYGVTAYTTSLRTWEFGVRMALGATPGQVLALVLRQGMVLAVSGLTVGALIALALTRLLGSVLVGVGSGSPFAVCLAAGLALASAAIACWVPARRATRIDPISALREDGT